MSSSDVHDILNLQGDAAPRPAKKQKVAAPRPVLKGLAREVQNLGGDNPIAIVPEVTTFKKRRFGSRKPAAKWELKPFKNSARDDINLVLRHWRRKVEAIPTATRDDTNMEGTQELPKAEIEDSTFAKFNVHVSTPDYSDEQYTSQLQSATWTKSETDYLMRLVKDYDLRWPVIWDRYEYQPPSSDIPPEAAENAVAVVPPPPRSMEDMKSRYYFIAAAMLRIQKPVETMNTSEFNLLETLQGFNPAQETARKKYAEAQFHRSKEEAREEESLLVELKRILARSEKLSEERRELYARLDAPPSTGNISIYTSSQGLNQLVQQLAQVDKSKRKSLVGREGISPAGPSSSNPQSSFDRRDSTVRESISGPSGNNKKGSVQTPSDRRQLSEQEEQLYGIRRFERITTTGPAFRHEKIQKPISSKSSIQQTKIHNVLAELRVPPRLLMPTYRVGELFEELVQNILGLIEQRKIADKLQGEINLIKQVREEKAKAARAERGEAEPGDTSAQGAGEVEGAEVKVEDQDVREKSAAPSVPGGAAHKRSASVLSAVSDKSTKRQRK